MSPANKKLLAILAASASAVLLAACSNDALDRRDKVALTAGNAPKSNNIIHADDPWPPNVNNRDIPTSGRRGENIVKKYNKGPAEPPPASNTITMTLPPIPETPPPSP